MKSKKTNPLKFFNNNKAMAKAKAEMEMKKFKKSLVKAQYGIVGPKTFGNSMLGDYKKSEFAPTPSGYMEPKISSLSNRLKWDRMNLEDLELRRAQRQQEEMQQGLKQQRLERLPKEENNYLDSSRRALIQPPSMLNMVSPKNPYEVLQDQKKNALRPVQTIADVNTRNVGIAPNEKSKIKPLEPRKNTLIKNKKGGTVKRKKK